MANGGDFHGVGWLLIFYCHKLKCGPAVLWIQAINVWSKFVDIPCGLHCSLGTKLLHYLVLARGIACFGRSYSSFWTLVSFSGGRCSAHSGSSMDNVDQQTCVRPWLSLRYETILPTILKVAGKCWSIYVWPSVSFAKASRRLTQASRRLLWNCVFLKISVVAEDGRIPRETPETSQSREPLGVYMWSCRIPTKPVITRIFRYFWNLCGLWNDIYMLSEYCNDVAAVYIQVFEYNIFILENIGHAAWPMALARPFDRYSPNCKIYIQILVTRVCVEVMWPLLEWCDFREALWPCKGMTFGGLVWVRAGTPMIFSRFALAKFDQIPTENLETTSWKVFEKPVEKKQKNMCFGGGSSPQECRELQQLLLWFYRNGIATCMDLTGLYDWIFTNCGMLCGLNS